MYCHGLISRQTMQAQVEAVGGAQGEEEGGAGGEGGQKGEGELPQVGKIRKYGRNEKPSFFPPQIQGEQIQGGKRGQAGKVQWRRRRWEEKSTNLASSPNTKPGKGEMSHGLWVSN